MQPEIENQKLEKILNDSKKLIKEVGIDMAKMIKRRLNEMKASPNFKAYLDYNIGNPHLLTGNFSGCYGISLSKNYRLIVEPKVNNNTVEGYTTLQTLYKILKRKNVNSTLINILYDIVYNMDDPNNLLDYLKK